jgi:hypothetical protein
MPGAKGRTIYNFCNRQVMQQEGCMASPTQRSHRFTDNKTYNKKQQALSSDGRLKARSIERYSTIVIDEANLNSFVEFMDAIQVAGAHHMQIVVICDYDDSHDTFKQLYGIYYHFNIKSPSFMRARIASTLGGEPTVGRIAMTEVFRQKDELLKSLLRCMRDMSGDAKGQLSLYKSLCTRPREGFVDELFPRFVRMAWNAPFLNIRPNNTKIVSPRHKILETMGQRWLNHMTSAYEDDMLIEVMWSKCGMTKKNKSDTEYSRIHSWFDNDSEYICKYDTAMVSWKELNNPEVRAVWKTFPYQKLSCINLSMFRTPFALQGTELRLEDDIITLWRGEEQDNGWSDDDQPNAVYVVLSRALYHKQIMMVDL